MNKIRTCILIMCFIQIATAGKAQTLGVFTKQDDIGAVLHQGSAIYNASDDQFKVSGSGSNIWFAGDQFHFVYRKIRGDFIVQAKGHLVGKGVEAHRKFGWMARKSLDTGSAMVCTTVHGDGLTSLQFRKSDRVNVEELKSDISSPDMIQLERRGNTYIMSVAHFGEPYASKEITNVELGDELYIGLFVCAHNKDVVETAAFDNVRLIIPAKENFVPYKDYIGSNIELMDVDNGKRKIIYKALNSLQAPNWLRDGRSLVYNSEGSIFKLDIGSDNPIPVNTGEVKSNNNDHALSFDGKMLGLSSSSPDGQYNSVVYTVPISGGTPRQITPIGPSYLHGWSPDKKYLIFTGQRNNEFDIYRIPVNGGKEERLTTAKGLDDGSEYTPDGKHIYFNSVRSGTMQIWRMDSDGSNQVQITSDGYNNWFPHISPDGKWIVFLSFQNDVKPEDHPFYKHVYLRLLPVSGGQSKVIAYLYGGQGSINTPSWSPDSKKIAFISNSDQIRH